MLMVRAVPGYRTLGDSGGTIGGRIRHVNNKVGVVVVKVKNL